MAPRVLLPVFLAVLLLACGGGGGGGGTGEPPPAPPPPSESGLDARPNNTACVAPPREAASAGVTAQRVFSNLTFAAPVALLQAPGDASRWFVVEQQGRIRAFENSAAAAATQDFLDLRTLVHFEGEAGLLGLAFHPDFAANGLAYVNYVASVDGSIRSVTSEFSSPDGGLTLDPASERVLITSEKSFENHNGGNIAFGPDGFLYVGLGDGGGGGDPDGNAQNPERLLGKMLRIDVDQQPGGAPYAIPADNPYAGNALCSADGRGAANCPEIFALGFRNPWRWSFDRQTGELWVADVGQASFEEIDLVERGGNYGWDTREGAHCFEPANDCPTAGLTDPVAEYGRDLGFSITGGFVYRGTRSAELAGRYVFADFGSGMIGALPPDGNGGYAIEELVEAGSAPPGAAAALQVSAFGQDTEGELYVLDYGTGEIRQLVFSASGGGDSVPRLLSETGCIDPSEAGAPPLLDLIPYAPNAPFWSDGAAKDRWIGLPNGEDIDVRPDGDWELPNGTVLVKHFRLGERLVETRLFMRHPDGAWAGYTYQWNEAQTDATRVSGGLTARIGDQDWIFPSEAQCLQCHTRAAGFSLGLETAQLNRTVQYPQTGRTARQIPTLNAIRALAPPIAGDPPAYADPDDTSEPLEARARSYLHTNCANCHRPQGPTPVALDLRHDTPLAETGICDVSPTAGELDIADARIVAPGDAARSVLLARMSRRDADAMPPVGSNLRDAGGETLIGAWIDSLTPASCQ